MRVQEVAAWMSRRPTEEVLAVWRENDRKKWSDAAIEAAKKTLVERGVALPPQLMPPEPRPPGESQTLATPKKRPRRQRFEKATLGDVVLSVVLPGWGILVGLTVLCKGERKRAATMIVIGACVLAVVALARGF
jgi:hypothetical protein